MIIVPLIIALFFLLLIDLPLLRSGKNKPAFGVYCFLMFIGFVIAIIVIGDLPVSSPAILIENVIKTLFER
jgi:hypothetical protein